MPPTAGGHEVDETDPQKGPSIRFGSQKAVASASQKVTRWQ
jgi:hypothetical protein